METKKEQAIYYFDLNSSDAIRDAIRNLNDYLGQSFKAAVIDPETRELKIFFVSNTPDQNIIIESLFALKLQATLLMHGCMISSNSKGLAGTVMYGLRFPVTNPRTAISQFLKCCRYQGNTRSAGPFKKLSLDEILNKQTTQSSTTNQTNTSSNSTSLHVQASYELEFRKKVADSSKALEDIKIYANAVKKTNGNFFAPGTDSKITVLHLAAKRGDIEILKYLLKLGAEVTLEKTNNSIPLVKPSLQINAIDAVGNTPLHYACLYGHNACIQILVRQLANPLIKNKEEKTALQLWAEKNNFQAEEFISLEGENHVLLELDLLKSKDSLTSEETKQLLLGHYMQMELMQRVETNYELAKTWNPKTIIWKSGKVSYSDLAASELEKNHSLHNEIKM